MNPLRERLVVTKKEDGAYAVSDPMVITVHPPKGEAPDALIEKAKELFVRSVMDDFRVGLFRVEALLLKGQTEEAREIVSSVRDEMLNSTTPAWPGRP